MIKNKIKSEKSIWHLKNKFKINKISYKNIKLLKRRKSNKQILIIRTFINLKMHLLKTIMDNNLLQMNNHSQLIPKVNKVTAISIKYPGINSSNRFLLILPSHLLISMKGHIITHKNKRKLYLLNKLNLIS